MTKRPPKRDPDRLKINMDWTDAADRLLRTPPNRRKRATKKPRK